MLVKRTRHITINSIKDAADAAPINNGVTCIREEFEIETNRKNGIT